MAAKQAPSSVLIIGSGVFGLGTAHALAQRPEFKKTRITLLERLDFPAPDAASIDSSRIVRADYADAPYAALMSDAHKHWRGQFGADGRYTEAGLCLVTDQGTSGGDAGDVEHAHNFIENAMKNVKALGLREGRREEGGQVEPLRSPADVSRVLTMTGDCGKSGYVNWTSGWAHAENGIRYMRRLAEKTGRIDFKTAEVKRLRFGNGRVESVELVTGQQLTADLIILAAGAWTPKFIDLRGIASASGQAVAYIDITPEEQARLAQNSTLINEDNGMFIIQPKVPGILKVARHGYGYANPVTIPHPERPGETITVSLPRTKQDDPTLNIPYEAVKECRNYLARTNPELADRPWTQTRICWYCDTPSGDYLVDYHPKYSNLFVATGGSGHAYKFLPVIGERIVDVLLGEARDELGRQLRRKWRWPMQRQREDHVWTNDWRGGKKGMVLDEELARGQARVVGSGEGGVKAKL
ncbi:FAD dependent oxidoreductase [Teratosphaeria nubilosa]|uniref:FAD dependent oxidoreductase n=1 Tax=Teratosphaeria nubilosa TaxID=161662 RepID=A0A6G1L3N1_9PEZI|nr:FAD dependent oxidoreductase [Teratosphaeria nubilosa]